jgi:hypothetical protein
VTFEKTNAQEIAFRITLQPDEERSVTYTVHHPLVRAAGKKL